MSYTLQVEQRNDYLYFQVEGDASYETGMGFWREIGSKCKNLGYKKLLIKENLEGQVSDAEMFWITARFREFGFIGKKIAFIDRYANHDYGNGFGQLVASNRGILMRIFKDIDEAEKWIISS
jgi:hypothetical protein